MAVTVLALDCSTRMLGWCCTASGERVYGLIKLPGMKDLGMLHAAVRNSLVNLIEGHKPGVLCWCRPMFRDQQTAAEALLGVAAVAHLTAYDYGLRVVVEAETTARKYVLGRGTFGERDPVTKKIIKGSGSRAAKAAALAWCAARGIETTSDDVADACVLHQYVSRFVMARRMA